jgi:hypothetical protein
MQAIWAEDGSWSYWIPIYMYIYIDIDSDRDRDRDRDRDMLNSIIQLQAVVEIITNKTAKAHDILARQSTKMCNAI